jgi:hypothetical protein
MNYKTTYILFGVLVGILVLVGLVLLIEPTPYVDTSRYVLPSAHDKKAITSDAVTRVEIERTRPDPQTIVFERDADSNRWSIIQPRPYRANASVVEGLVRQVLEAQSDAKAAIPPDRKAAELDPPAEIVTLKTKDGKELKLNVGGEGGFGAGVAFVTSSDKSAVMAVPRSAIESVFKKLDDFRDPYLLAASPSDYQHVKLTLSKVDKKEAPKGALVLVKKSEGLWEYKDPEGYDGSAEEGEASTVPPTGVEGLLKELSDLKVDSVDKGGFVEDDAKDLAKYNLDPAKSDVLTIEVDRIDSIKDENGTQATKTSPVTLLVGVGKKVDDKAADAKYYAALKGEHGNTVVEVAAKGPSEIAALFKDPAKLRNHSLAALGPAEKPVAVDVVNGPSKLEFRRENGTSPWHLYRDGAEIPLSKDTNRDPNGDPVQRFVNQLVQKVPVASFLDPKADQAKLGLGKPSVVVSIWVDGVEKQPEEKKDDKKDPKEADKKAETKTRLVLAKDKVDKPASRLTFGAVEGKEVVIKRQAYHKGWDETALVKTPDLLLDEVKQGPLAYEDKTLPSFNGQFDLPDKDVVQLALDRGGVHYLVTRADAKPETPWTFAAPKDMAGRKVSKSAVEQILAELHGLRATRLVTESPKDDELDKEYGLKTPTLKAVVTKTDKTSYTYDFGKDAAGGGEYARQSQRPMVFVVDKTRLEALQKDLRDPTIFAVADTSKVKALKLTGWVNVTGMPTTWDFERKDGKWAVKTPAPNTIAVDQDKVRILVEGLAHLTAKRFVGQDAKIKAAFDKDEDKTALTIDMTVEGQEKPLQLKVVNLTGDKAALGADKGYYAASPSAAGELFEVTKELFDGPMSKPAYFIKP